MITKRNWEVNEKENCTGAERMGEKMGERNGFTGSRDIYIYIKQYN